MIYLKCTFCGSLNMEKTNDTWTEDNPFIRNKINTYICKDCGHYEFFSKSAAIVVEENNDMKESQLKSEIELLEKQLLKTNISRDEQIKLTKQLTLLKNQLKGLVK